jgi:uncharacterized damage-inducible protein DinB
MRKIALTSLLLSLSAIIPVHAQDAAKPAGFRGEFLTQLDDVEKKMVSLAEAMPEEKYSWRPGKGVRSVGEVYVHIATANYGIPIFLGVKPPAGFDRNAEKTVTAKPAILDLLKASFENVRQTALKMTDADLEKQVKFFGGKMVSERSVLLLMATHMHEHMGQSIAYARTNGVVPPWSAGKAE